MTDEIHHHHIESSGLSLAWAGTPSPTPLAFLHGLGDSSIATFRPIAEHPALSDRAALFIDLPGFGYSTAPDSWPATVEDHADAVVTLLEELGVQDATLIGHSMGGSTALVVAQRAPHRLKQLVLAEPLLVREHSQLAKAIAKREEDDFVARGYAMLLHATRRQANRGDRAAAGFLKPLERANPRILHRTAVSLLADRSPGFLDLIGSIPLPRTLLVGEHTQADHSIIPEDVPVITIPDAGHSMMSENPDAFAHAITRSLTGQ